MVDIAESIKRIKADALKTTTGTLIPLKADQVEAFHTALDKTLATSTFGKPLLADADMTTAIVEHLNAAFKTNPAMTPADITKAVKEIADTGMIPGLHNTLAGHSVILKARQDIAVEADKVVQKVAERDVRKLAYEKLAGVSTGKGPKEIIEELGKEVTRLNGITNPTPAQIAEKNAAVALHDAVDAIAKSHGIEGVGGVPAGAAADVIKTAEGQVTHIKGILGQEKDLNFKHLSTEAEAAFGKVKGLVTTHNEAITVNKVGAFFKPADLGEVAKSLGVTLGADGKVASIAAAAKGAGPDAAKEGVGFFTNLLHDSEKVKANAGKAVVFGEKSTVHMGKAAGVAALAALGLYWLTGGKGEQQAHRGA